MNDFWHSLMLRSSHVNPTLVWAAKGEKNILTNFPLGYKTTIIGRLRWIKYIL